MSRAAYLLLAGVLLAACGDDGNTHGDAPPPTGSDASIDPICAVHPATFVRQAFLAIAGRRPLSQAETDVYVDLYTAAAGSGADPKETVARALMARPEFAERWIDVTMDALHVQRTDVQNESACWMTGLRTTTDPMLATAVRDQAATGAGDGHGKWSLVDLARSSLALDDLTPIYRAQLFSLVAHPIPAANVDPVEAELARREDFGTTFDAGYLHRDIVCLGCHTSEHSVTDSDDPALDRFWPVPGAPEAAVYGDATGVSPGRAHAAFRVDGFLSDGSHGNRPWGWDDGCGLFNAPASLANDPAGLDAKLASITGEKATVYDLERVLARGFASLEASGPPTAQTPLTDPDAALAWLVTMKMAEDVWKEATGTPLTIANYFPRNQASSDQLTALASTLVTHHYSLQALLVAVVTSEFYDLPAPEAGCGSGAYPLPNVFDPWVIADPDEALRHNGAGDSIQPVPPRALVTATNAALGWGAPPDATRFPDYGEGCEDTTCGDMKQFCQQFGACCVTEQAVCVDHGQDPTAELAFERGVGMFLRNSERGFSGLDFQGRLAWEDRYGACGKPAWVTTDAIDDLVAAGAADPTATARDVVAALKDRLVGEPAIDAGAETAALTAVVGSLEGPASGVTVPAARQVCAALLASPQFLLRGMAGRGGDRPKLTPASASYAAACAELAAHGLGAGGAGVTCDTGKVVLGAAAPRPPRVRTVPVGVPHGLGRPRGKPPARRPAPLATPGPMRHVPRHAN